MNSYRYDYFRYSGAKKLSCFKILTTHHNLFLLLSRLRYSVHNYYLQKIITFIARRYGLRYGLELDTKNIGPGILLGPHAFNISVNSEAILGKNINLNKGCTVGKRSRGKYKGSPVLGNNVYVGINSTIIGNVKIGDNVQIAPNTLVTTDVPSNSVVIGSPAIIKENRMDATEGYILNRI